MPNIVVGNPENAYADSTILDKDLDYDYPYGLNLKPGSKVHEKIKTEVMSRARESHALISNRVDSWNQIERVMTAYIDLSETEKDIKSSDSRKPVSIVFPYTYVILETVLTYLTTVFLNDPIFRYKGSSPEDVIGAIMLEKVVQNQSNFFKVDLALYTFLRDSIVYGLGACAPVWEKRMGMKIRERKGGLIDFFRGHGERVYEEGVIYEGNKLENIDPYLYLPDPRVPSQKIQDGEYVGWIDKTSRMALLREEKNSNDMFNAKYLKAIMMKRSSIFAAGESDRNKKTGISDYASYDTRIHNPVDVIYMYIDLIPKEWELGTSEYPEKWLFGLGNDAIVLKAKKLGLAHGLYPIAVATPDFDGYSVLPLARSEMLYGMQTVLDWLFNSHIANVRKSINDMLVVDPYLVNIADLKDPEPGKLIRMRRPAWGKGVKDAVQQLMVNDITRGNIADSAMIVQWMQKIGAADESMMGALRQGGPERLTGQEFQGTRAGAVGRLEKVAKIIGSQGMRDIAYMFASHNQQLMSQETYIDVVGTWQDELTSVFGDTSKLKVSPYDLLINYDVVVQDGSLPGNSDAKSWIRLYDILAKNPEVGKQFDMVRIFEHIALEMGAKSVHNFKINPKVVPDEVAMREREKGNIVPMDMGGRAGGMM